MCIRDRSHAVQGGQADAQAGDGADDGQHADAQGGDKDLHADLLIDVYKRQPHWLPGLGDQRGRADHGVSRTIWNCLRFALAISAENYF